jgi:pimeloyl-ACP methyl ester carboxylesterase
MAEKLQTFMTPELKDLFHAAYAAVMKHWPTRFEELYIPTRFGPTHVIANGSMDAPPLVLLHPGGGNATMWFRNAGPLGEHFRTYAVDIIGEMNESVPTRRISSHKEFGLWMSDLFEGLQIERAHLVGNSSGGFFALSTAIQLPDRVKKVVLISPAASFVQMWPWWWHLLIPAHIIAPVIHSERMVHRAYAWLWQGFPMDECFRRLHFLSKVSGYPRYRPTRNSIAPYVFDDDELRKVKSPVLLLIGDHEVIYKTEKALKRAMDLVEGLKASIVPNANHCARTAPEEVNRMTLEFLTS